MAKDGEHRLDRKHNKAGCLKVSKEGLIWCYRKEMLLTAFFKVYLYI